jgi:EAL domain-containing protein (putative c-di-GMP-specific phosphodiesterase class I)
VAERLSECVRFSDEVARPNVLAVQPVVSRLGGDEFTILLTQISDPLDAAVVATRILAALARPFELEAHEIFSTASIGIAVFPDDGQDAETLYHNADQAMYQAKQRGRNRYAFFSHALNEASQRRHALEQRLRHALERGEFALHYQAVRHARSGQLLGAEALLRWSNRELGMIAPSEFLPIAEDTGLMVPIGQWVLHTACEQMRAWRQDGLGPVLVSVNLSGVEFLQAGLPDLVSQTLEDTDTSPAQLELEITESTLMDDEEAAVQLLRELKELGISLSLDDFGTGYSSLSYLRLLPIDTLKIDRSFVRRIANDEDDAALVGAIISMAKALRLRVVVEGVETEQQRDCLYELGCDEIQGFLFSVPLAANSAAALLKSHHEQLQAHPQQRERRRKKR